MIPNEVKLVLDKLLLFKDFKKTYSGNWYFNVTVEADNDMKLTIDNVISIINKYDQLCDDLIEHIINNEGHYVDYCEIFNELCTCENKDKTKCKECIKKYFMHKPYKNKLDTLQDEIQQLREEKSNLEIRQNEILGYGGDDLEIRDEISEVEEKIHIKLQEYNDIKFNEGDN